MASFCSVFLYANNNKCGKRAESLSDCLSLTGVSYLISLLILANLLSCPFVLLIVPHLIFLALSIVRVFSGIKLWENSMLYSPQVYPGLIISMQLFTKAILLFISCIEHFLLPHLSRPNNYFSLVWYSPNLPTALLFGGWMWSKIHNVRKGPEEAD